MSYWENIEAGFALFDIRERKLIFVEGNAYLQTLKLDGAMLNENMHGLREHLSAPDQVKLREGLNDFFEFKNTVIKITYLADQKTSFSLRLSLKLKGVQALLTIVDLSQETKANYRNSHILELYEAAVSEAKLAVWEYDILHHRVTMVDNELTRYDYTRLGLSRVMEDVPDAFEDYVHPDDWPAFKELHNKVERGEPMASVEVWNNPKPGTEPLCERITYITFFDDANRPTHAYGIGQNITLEKKSEERYYKELDYIKDNNQANLVAKGHYNLTKNKVIGFSHADDQAFHLPVDVTYDDVVKNYLEATLTLDSRKALAEILDREGLIAKYHDGVTHFYLEYKREKFDQSPLWVTTVVNTFISPISNDVECFLYTYDETEKILEKQMVSKMAVLGYDYFGIINLKNGIFKYYRSIDGNQMSDASVNYEEDTRDRIISFGLAEQQKEILVATSLSVIKEKLEHSPVYRVNYGWCEDRRHIQQKSMLYTYLDLSKDQIFACCSDVTKQYRDSQEQMEKLQAAMEEAQRANESRSTFLSSISHDMRTPLNGIVGYTHLALETTDAHKKEAFLRKIQASSTLLLNLINDSLELSKIESGKMTLNETVGDMPKLVEEVMTLVQAQALEKNLDIKILDDGKDFPSLLMDHLKIEKVFMNILSNSIKFTPRGGHITIEVSKTMHHDPETNCEIKITDDGIGISEDFLPSLYEPFTKGHDTSSVEMFGTGLGLSIVKQIVEIMGGRIHVDSTVGKGTCVTVLLPLKEKYGSIAPTNPQNEFASLRDKRIMIVEDNELNMEIATTLLSTRDMFVVQAKDGQEALDLFVQSPVYTFDAILMDIQMPHMDGYQTTKEIRSLRREDANVPIIAMTADAYEEDIQKCLDAGMQAHLAKPLDPGVMLSTIAKYIK